MFGVVGVVLVPGVIVCSSQFSFVSCLCLQLCFYRVRYRVRYHFRDRCRDRLRHRATSHRLIFIIASCMIDRYYNLII